VSGYMYAEFKIILDNLEMGIHPNFKERIFLYKVYEYIKEIELANESKTSNERGKVCPDCKSEMHIQYNCPTKGCLYHSP
jgi:hypothetical protein